MNFQDADNLIFAAAGALIAIFFCASILLIFVCLKLQKRRIKFEEFNATKSPSTKNKSHRQELSLVDIGLGNALEQVIIKLDTQWTMDHEAYDTFIPICLEILKRCHNFTDRLTTTLFGSKSDQLFGSRIVDISRSIPKRVDDIVRSIYPRLDVQLLEARTTNLILSVGQLAILAKHNMAANNKSEASFDWIDTDLKEMEAQLTVCIVVIGFLCQLLLMRHLSFPHFSDIASSCNR
jgi:hypothetical protein